MSLSRVGILYHPMVEAAYTLAGELEKLLRSKGASVWLCSAWEEEEARARLDSTDLILTTGGDGTILRAAQLALPAQTPITGINLGRLGFMTELTTDEAMVELPSLLEGKGWIDERALLEAELLPLEGGAPRMCYALNDVVVTRGTVTRVVYVNASIDGEPLTTYKGDGVIAATATGSTAYALAAGGPILHPRSEEFLLLPILPHLSSDYTLVLPPSAVVKLHVTTAHQAGLSIDGHINLPLSSGATITVKHSVKKVRFLRTHPRASFYATLEQRLKGKR